MLRSASNSAFQIPHSALPLSYSTFKRVFGESSLERKCRWWFGVSLGLLIFLSLLAILMFRTHGHPEQVLEP